MINRKFTIGQKVIFTGYACLQDKPITLTGIIDEYFDSRFGESYVFRPDDPEVIRIVAKVSELTINESEVKIFNLNTRL